MLIAIGRSQRIFNALLRGRFSTSQPTDVRAIEAKWKGVWPTLFRNQQPGEKFYCLVQFPYPSGNLHIGHARVYYISDTIARYNRLRGRNVIHPIGWDSFGLPAENAAISRRINPRIWTEQNIADMKEQLMKLGVWFDWERELATHEPEYYKWTQKIFLELFKQGLAYKKEAQVNWDPVDQTVLANEQVDANGNSWRSGAKVEKRKLSQWFFRITAYSKELNDDLALLERWPERVKQMQAGWIGVKNGHQVSFRITEHNDASKVGTDLNIFTTRVQTIMGCTFLAVSTSNKQGSIVGKCVHPITGESLPIYQAEYVAGDFGTGAVMGVPAHDDNDKKFAENFSISQKVIFGEQSDRLINSGQFTGLSLVEGRNQIAQELHRLKRGEQQTHTHLRDWLVSRQRYWGAPIPVVYCSGCGIQPVPESDLPVLLPRSDLSEGNPLLSKEFKSTCCPKCGGAAQRQTDTLDTFVDSSWYFLRYLDNKDKQSLFKKEAIEAALPVDVYIGGIEHAVMHLLYARFAYKVLHRYGFLGKVWEEPFKQLIVQGLVKGKSFRLKSNGRYLTPEQARTIPSEELIVQFEKMSKSKFNGVNPTDIVDRYGCDPLRAAMLFSAPVQKDIEFTQEEVLRMQEFLGRVIRFVHKTMKLATEEEVSAKQNWLLSESEISTFEKVVLLAEDIMNALQSSYAMHVYAARLMELFNLIKDSAQGMSIFGSRLAIRILTVSLTPLSPHIGQELWSHLPPISSLLESSIFAASTKGQMVWPNIQKLKSQIIDSSQSDVMVSRNNKFLAKIRLPTELLEQCLKSESAKHTLIHQLRLHPKLKILADHPVRQLVTLKTPRAYVVNILST